MAKRRLVMSIVQIAVVPPEEFERARGAIPGLAEQYCYEDWLDCREGLFMGLSISGIDSRLVSVSLEAFLRWCDDRVVTPSESLLDSFASIEHDQ
jgi:hypothetical protein